MRFFSGPTSRCYFILGLCFAIQFSPVMHFRDKRASIVAIFRSENVGKYYFGDDGFVRLGPLHWMCQTKTIQVRTEITPQTRLKGIREEDRFATDHDQNHRNAALSESRFVWRDCDWWQRKHREHESDFSITIWAPVMAVSFVERRLRSMFS